MAALFQTWLIYSLVMCVGFFVLNTVFPIFPPLQRYFRNQVRRFLLYFTLGWIGGSAALAIIMTRDLDTHRENWAILAVSFALGIAVIFLITRLIKRDSQLWSRSAILISGLIILVNLVYLISDFHYTALIHARNKQFQGIIPHLCLIILDTTRGDHLSCYGYPYQTSPNFDKVATQGLLCANAFSASNWTPPGHISIFTGKYPSQHGTNGRYFMPDDLLSLSEILKQEGYFGLAIYNNKIAGRNVNITQGFDLDFGVYLDAWVYPAWKRLYDKYQFRDRGSRATFPMALSAFRWIADKGGHLYLYLNLFEPHWAYEVHEPFFSNFISPAQIAEISDLEKVDSLCYWRRNIIYDSTRFESLDESGYQYLRAAYDSEIAYMDHQFGTFYNGMQRDNLLDQLLLIVTADHGEFLGEHHTLGHPAVLFDPVLKIPLMIRYPQLIAPSVIEEYVSNVDIFPTVLNLMGYAGWIAEDVEGVDIFDRESLSGRSILSENLWPTLWIDPQEEIVTADYEGACYALRTGSDKLMVNNDSLFLQWFPVDTALFDIAVDPGESHDLRSIQPFKTDSLLRQLDEWVERITVSPTDRIDVTPEMLETLRALGYVH